MRAILEARALLAMVVTAIVGTWGLHTYPVQTDNAFLGLIAVRTPFVFHVLTYGYATLWFTTPFFVASLALSMLAIVVFRHPAALRRQAVPYVQGLTRLSQRTGWQDGRFALDRAASRLLTTVH